jgi:hypothetical protein
MNRTTGYNSTYKKLAVQWLNEALCFVSSSVLADSFVLRNRQLLVAAKRQAVKKPHIPYNSPFKIASSPNFKHHIRLSF